MRLFGLPFLRALFLAAGLAAAALSSAMAQENQISDAKLQSFVVAAMKVSGLIDQWTPRIEAAKTPEEKAQLKQTANGQLVQAIQSDGDLNGRRVPADRPARRGGQGAAGPDRQDPPGWPAAEVALLPVCRSAGRDVPRTNWIVSSSEPGLSPAGAREGDAAQLALATRRTLVTQPRLRAGRPETPSHVEDGAVN
jgi:hypothetical protein